MAEIGTADLAIPDFMGAIIDHAFPAHAFLIAFSTAEAKFDHFYMAEDFISQTIQGRIFSPQGELKWRKLDGLMRTVYLGEGPLPDKFEDNHGEIDALKKELREYYLWGRYRAATAEWIEQQVPHRFKYPLNGVAGDMDRVVLVTEAWVDGAGIPRFQRYYDVKVKRENDHAKR